MGQSENCPGALCTPGARAVERDRGEHQTQRESNVLKGVLAQICHKKFGAQKEPRKSLILVGRIGFEPMTNWLKVHTYVPHALLDDL